MVKYGRASVASDFLAVNERLQWSLFRLRESAQHTQPPSYPRKRVSTGGGALLSSTLNTYRNGILVAGNI